VNCDLDRAMPKKDHALRPSELLIGAAALLPAALRIRKEVKRTDAA
jgi:hypothetical protein